MPVYVYRCQNCGFEFEKFQHYTDDPITICPECGEASLQKVWQPTSVIYKGQGWYSKDTAKQAQRS